MRGGEQNEITTANLLIRQKGAASHYSGRFTPHVEPNGDREGGVKCFYGPPNDAPDLP